MKVTASQSARLLQCSFWADKDYEKDSSGGPEARWGSAFHEMMAARLAHNIELVAATVASKWYLNIGDAPELDFHVRRAYDVLLPWLEGDNPWAVNFRGPNYSQIVEKSYWLNGDNSGECELVEEGHTYNNVPEGAIPGTVDYAALTEDYTSPCLVLDHKTGQGDYSSPGANKQLLTLAAMLNTNVLAVLHAPRGGKPVVYADEVEWSTIDAHKRHLSAAIARIGDGSMRPGPECRYCPHRNLCPAKQGELLGNAKAAIEATGAAIALVRAETGNLSLRRRGELHALATAAEKIVAAVKAENKAFVRDNPGELLTLPNGKCLQLTTRRVERLSKAAILKALGKFEGERVLQELRDKGALVEAEEEVLTAVDLEGANGQ